MARLMVAYATDKSKWCKAKGKSTMNFYIDLDNPLREEEIRHEA